MQIKRIQCPQCQTVLDVKNQEETLEKHINCPRCGTELIVKFKPKADPVEAHTFYARQKPTYDSCETQLGGSFGGGSSSGDETQLGTGSANKVETYARLSLNGMTYTLKEGRNIVGRRASTSPANIQLATDDLSMSRQHIIINVTTMSDGTKKAVLSNYQNKNVTSIDGFQIDSGDAIRLADGNTITMGRTTVTFILKQ